MCMYWFLEDRVIASSPKVATRSLTALFGAPQTNITIVQERLVGKESTLFIRDPMERLVSAYANMSKRADILINWPGLVNSILSGHQDIHWMPQVGMHTYDGRFLPTAVLPFERLPEYIKSLGFDLPHENRSVPVGDEDLAYRLPEVHDYYQKDFDLRSCL